jgi:hypothetical protein
MKSQVLLSFVVLRKTQKPRVINNLSVWSRVQASCPKRRAHVLRSLKLRLDTYRIYSTTYYVLTSHVRLLTTHQPFFFSPTRHQTSNPRPSISPPKQSNHEVYFHRLPTCTCHFGICIYSVGGSLENEVRFAGRFSKSASIRRYEIIS